MKGISALKKERDSRELPCPFLLVRTWQEDNVYESGRERSPETDPAGTPISDFQPPEL